MDQRSLIATVCTLIAGCGRIGFDDALGDGGPNPTADAPATCAFGPWSPPTLIAELSTTDNDWGGQISADGLTLYFNIARTVMVSQRPTRTSPFNAAVAVTDLGAGLDAGNPSFSGDGLILFFDSSRGAKYDAYSVTRAATTQPFSNLVRTGLYVNTEVTAPYLTADGLTVYYMLGIPEGTLEVSTRASTTDDFQPGSPVSGITGAMNGTPALSADQLTIYFDSGTMVRSTLDIYQASRPDVMSPFGLATSVSVDTLNSAESDASITADGLELFFASDRPGGMGNSDLYVATRTCL